MESLHNKIVFITGASSGIGKACAVQFASYGAKLILAARRLDQMNLLAKELQTQYKTDILTIQLDVRQQHQVNHAIENLPPIWQRIDILINNAGLALSLDPLQSGDPSNWDTMIDTNIKGLLYVTRAILPGMIKREAGHIVNLGSLAGHDYYPGGNIYSATKSAVQTISKSLRIDLVGTQIRVSEIDPGAVATEFSEVRFKDKKRADKFYASFTPLQAEDIADAIIYCVTRKPHVNIAQIILTATEQASSNHGAHIKK